MKERPILFSRPMVRAILDGRKTQTRRVQPLTDKTVLDAGQRKIGFTFSAEHAVVGDLAWLPIIAGRPKIEVDEIRKYQQLSVPVRHPEDKDKWSECPRTRMYCPYGAPGDLLWVRETFLYRLQKKAVLYRANFDSVEAAGLGGMYGGWHPSIHMPRKFSRLTLKITAVRAQRLQDTSAGDILAEGAVLRPHMDQHLGKCPISAFDEKMYVDLKSLWAAAWDGINAKRGFGWKGNPWVWAITFEKV